MSRVHAEINTFYGEFPADFEFSIDEDRIEGTYSFIGYEGAFQGLMTGEDTFSVAGTVDSYVGRIDFSIDGHYDGKAVIGDGRTGSKGKFTVRGIPIGEI